MSRKCSVQQAANAYHVTRWRTGLPTVRTTLTKVCFTKIKTLMLFLMMMTTMTIRLATTTSITHFSNS